jgi:hypothetical protein
MRVVAALVALLVVAGCAGDPQPKEPKPSTTVSASPTVTVPTMPAQAKEDTPSGAAAFVKHYIDVFNYAANTGDVDELSKLSSPKCDGCQSYIREFGSLRAKGKLIVGPLWKLTKVEVTTTKNPLQVTTGVNARVGAGAKRYKFDFTLSNSPPFEIDDVVIEGKS